MSTCQSLLTASWIMHETRKAAGSPAIVLGGCTPVLQPLDVSVNQPLKNVVQSLWVNYRSNEGRKVREGKLERIKAQSKQLIVDWVAAAIKSTPKPDLVRKSFIVTGINTSLDGADDQMVRCDTDTEHIQ